MIRPARAPDVLGRVRVGALYRDDKGVEARVLRFALDATALRDVVVYESATGHWLVSSQAAFVSRFKPVAEETAESAPEKVMDLTSGSEHV